MNNPPFQSSHIYILLNLTFNCTNNLRGEAFLPLDDRIKQVESHLNWK